MKRVESFLLALRLPGRGSSHERMEQKETILFIIALYIFIGMLCYRLAYEPAVAEFHRVQEENQELKKTLHQIKQEEQEVLNQADYVQAAGQQYHALIGSIPGIRSW